MISVGLNMTPGKGYEWQNLKKKFALKIFNVQILEKKMKIHDFFVVVHNLRINNTARK